MGELGRLGGLRKSTPSTPAIPSAPITHTTPITPITMSENNSATVPKLIDAKSSRTSRRCRYLRDLLLYIWVCSRFTAYTNYNWVIYVRISSFIAACGRPGLWQESSVRPLSYCLDRAKREYGRNQDLKSKVYSHSKD